MSANRLPAEFNLIWDIKTEEHVERIARGEGTHSDARPADLVSLYRTLDLQMPPALTAWCRDSAPWTYVLVDDTDYNDTYPIAVLSTPDISNEALLHYLGSYTEKSTQNIQTDDVEWKKTFTDYYGDPMSLTLYRFRPDQI
jgi:hypothetical protein